MHAHSRSARRGTVWRQVNNQHPVSRILLIKRTTRATMRLNCDSHYCVARLGGSGSRVSSPTGLEPRPRPAPEPGASAVATLPLQAALPPHAHLPLPLQQAAPRHDPVTAEAPLPGQAGPWHEGAHVTAHAAQQQPARGHFAYNALHNTDTLHIKH